MTLNGFSPPVAPTARSSLSVAEGEALLGQWFGRPVVLTSSGRAALLLALCHIGLNRYRSRVAISPRTAQCVLDAVIRAAFPVDPATDKGETQATVLIHQYGFIQAGILKGPAIEDICHSFFASPASGKRDWRASMAVFSLPKFLGMSGMCGGLAVADEALATALCERRDQAAALSETAMEHDRQSWLSGAAEGLEEIYLRALLHPACHPAALAGLPDTLDELSAIGEKRAETTRRLAAAIPDAWLDADWRAMCSGSLPYALPVFAGEEAEMQLAGAAAGLGFETGVYQVDRNRNMLDPRWEPAVLLPCHHAISEKSINDLVHVIAAACR